MKKVTLLLLLLFSLNLISCSEEALIVYEEAVVKTDEIKSAKAKTELEVKIEFGDELPENFTAVKDMLEHIKYVGTKRYDSNGIDKMIMHQLIETKSFGLDTVFYSNDKMNFIKLPFLGKFINLNEVNISGRTFESAPPLTVETINDIKTLWLDLANTDDVVNLGNEVVDTPEGEVKVQKLVIRFNDSQVKSFLKDVLVLLEEDSNFRSLVANSTSNIEAEIDIDIDFVIEFMGKMIDDMNFEEFEIITYIDIDKYIVNNESKVSISFDGDLGKIVKSLELTLFYQLYDIGEKIEFDFPVLNNENTSTVDELLKEMEFKMPIND